MANLGFLFSGNPRSQASSLLLLPLLGGDDGVPARSPSPTLGPSSASQQATGQRAGTISAHSGRKLPAGTQPEVPPFRAVNGSPEGSARGRRCVGASFSWRCPWTCWATLQHGNKRAPRRGSPTLADPR